MTRASASGSSVRRRPADKPAVHRSRNLTDVARLWGEANGYEVRGGGWIYQRDVAICRGWRAFGQLLVVWGIVRELSAESAPGTRIAEYELTAGS